ncbi:class I fumarate hydratase [Escherichia coli]|uniref:Class I fumarate hydratase n=1 Tax=Escherichia coli TaxID=562 RepID=A0A484X4G4_ECOLX|nr:class I fumarate hydratase [Escherichia coli]
MINIVALQFLRNSDIAAKGVLPTCQDTGTAIIVGKKGQRVWTVAVMKQRWRAVFITLISRIICATRKTRRWICIRGEYGTNLPAQIDLYAVDGDEYKSSVSPKVAVRQTRRISIRKPKRY